MRTLRCAGLILAATVGLGFSPRPGLGSPLHEVNLGGQLDLVAESRTEQDGINALNFGENPFHATRIRLFADAPVQDHVHVFTEFLFDDAAGRARLFGGFVRVSDPKGRDIHLEIGKIPLHLGAYPGRAYARRNNLIGAPLMYEYHTDLRSDQVPVRGEDIVANRGKSFEADYTAPGLTGLGNFEGYALPVLYDNAWDFGAVVAGTAAPFEFAAGVTNGSAAAPATSETNGGKQILARVGLMPAPWVRGGISVSRAPYLYEDLDEDLPQGKSVDQFIQKLAAADLELSYGHGVFYSEVLLSRFESPFVGDLDVRSWYFEGKWTLLPGWYVAGRYDRMMFGDIPLSTGGVGAWDADLWKRELGIGFKPSKSLVAKLVHQESRINVTPPIVRAFAAAQLSVTF